MALCFLLWGAHVESCLAICARVFPSCLALWSPHLGKRELVYVLLVLLFVFVRVKVCLFFSSSWCQWLAATCACGTSWNFLLTFFQSNKPNSSDIKLPFLDWIYPYAMVQFLLKFMINGTISSLILLITHSSMAMSLGEPHMECIYQLIRFARASSLNWFRCYHTGIGWEYQSTSSQVRDFSCRNKALLNR